MWSPKQIKNTRDLIYASCMIVEKVIDKCVSVIVYWPVDISCLFSILDGYNRYVEVVGGSIGAGACANGNRSGKIYKIDHDTKMLHFLSEENGANDWLYIVIDDIVS